MRFPVVLIVATGCGGATATAPTPTDLACQRGPDYRGSMHAELAYSTANPVLPEPTAKHAQSFTCAGAAGVVYRKTFATADDAGLALAAYGGELWGGPAPTADHSDELLSNGLEVAIASGPAVAELAHQLEHEGFSRYRADQAGSSIASRFAAELDCSATSKDLLRGWCVVTRLETSGFTMPDKAVTLFGISVALRPNGKIRESLTAADRINTLTMDAGHLQFRDVKPENAEERQQLAAVARGVVASLEQNQTTVPVSAGLARFADGQRSNAATGQAAHSDPHGFHFTALAPSRAYLVNNVYVIVEDEVDGTWVSVYPIAGYVGR